jgi:alkanesulfonate monooxygenase SsuD/methylene tetrahydromethanopterin reductase-like flavin-dependent oxidoreductase (luciferase family)
MPLSQPHPPIMIGGMGEQKTMRLVVKYADACNLFEGAGAEAMKGRLALIDQYCAEIGRDPKTIERTALGTVHIAEGADTADQVIARCRALADLGIEHIIFNMPNVQDLRPLEVFAKTIIPVVAEF